MGQEDLPERPKSRRRLRRERRQLRQWASFNLWRRRVVFLGGAVAVGVVSILFAEAANWAQAVFTGFAAQWRWAPLIVTPLGFALWAFVAARFFPGSQGSGIPQAIAALDAPGANRGGLLAPRMIFGKIALTVGGLLFGASSGREGPTVQVGAAIMLLVARGAKIPNEKNLILAGSAAGVAAAFNTPLAGVVFAIEELSRSFEQRANGVVLYGVVIAGLASLALVGDYNYFGSTNESVAGWRDWIFVVACGVGGGALGGAFARSQLAIARRLGAWTRAGRPWMRALLFALGCGVCVAALGVLSDGATFGAGYETARVAVEGKAPSSWYWPAKFLATLATAVSGVPGGIFAPSLSVGAGLGGWLGAVNGADKVGIFAVLGMAGYFAGVVQAPLTAFVIVLEMTGANRGVTPLLLASTLGYGASRLIAPQSLYHGLAEAFRPRRL